MMQMFLFCFFFHADNEDTDQTAQMQSRKHAYIILTPLNPNFI